MHLKISFVLLVGAFLLIADFGEAQVSPPTSEPSEPQFVNDELLVRFRPGTTPQTVAGVHGAVGSLVIRSFAVPRDLQLVRLPADVPVQRAIQSYRRDPSVLYAEPNYVRHTTDAPNDPRYPELWGLHNIGQTVNSAGAGTPGADIKALEAWTITTGSSDVVVGIIDTGVDYNHEDLAANLYRNEADCNHDGVDDDGNGYVDDCYGIDTFNGDSDPMDDHNHGTHVAGTIGAVGNNGIGVVGVNWKVKIVACKFLGAYGYGTDAGAVACLEYMDALRERGVNLVATSNSWGGGGFSQALYDAIDSQRRHGVLFIAAAANAARDNDGPSPNYPSSYRLSNVIAVAATDSRDGLAYFSNYGRRSVHLGAPGVNVLSTTRNNTYSFFSGTSMATPHVTGVAALLKAQGPARDFKVIRNLLLTGGDTIAALSTNTITQRRLNALGSLTCTDVAVYAPLAPGPGRMLATSGRPVTFTALNIKCANPNGAVEVTISPGGSTITLADDGQGGDQDANDGIYSGDWVPDTPGIYTFSFPGGHSGTIIVDPYTVTTADQQYRSIAGTSLGLSDDYYGFVRSPFPLNYAGMAAYEGIYASDNGVMTFDSGNLGAGNKPLPNPVSSTLVAPFWDDLLPLDPNHRNVFWEVRGASPSRELVIEWRDVGHIGCASDGSETVKFQVVLFENSADMLFNYADAIFGSTCTKNDSGSSATIGLQLLPDIARQFSYETPSVADNTSLVWRANFPENPAPAITSITPNVWAIGTYSTVIKITGANFQSGSVALWSGAPRWAQIISDTEMWLYPYGDDVANVGTYKVGVYNPVPGGGPSNEVDFKLTNPDFQLELSKTTLNVKAGAPDTVQVTLKESPVFLELVSLSCTGLPSDVTCSFTPQTVEWYRNKSTLALSRNAAASAQTTTTTAAARHIGLDLLWFPVASLALAGVARVGRNRKKAACLVAMLAALLAAGQFGCGMGRITPPDPPNPDPGTLVTTTYKIQVVGTSGSLKRSVDVTLNVTR